MAHSIVILLTNFVVIFCAIVLFIAPFYLWFRYLHRGTEKYRRNFNYSLEMFFTSKQANWLVLFWAMGEATFWFVIPEFLLLLMVFMRIHRKFELVIYDIYGTVIGTLIALSLHFSHASINAIPYIQPRMIDSVVAWYNHFGIGALIYQPFSGVPFKVFTFSAADYHFFVPLFVAFAVLVRVSRYFLAYAVLQSLYPVLHKYVYRNYVPLFIAAVFFFSAMLLRISLSYK